MSQTTDEHIDELAEVDRLTESERHRLLADERRRLALAILSERTTSIRLEELATEIAIRSEDIDPDDEEAVARVKTALHHGHLPKMSELGVIDYDPTSHRVTL